MSGTDGRSSLAQSMSLCLSAARARARRDLTVPTGQPMTSATSPSVRPSRSSLDLRGDDLPEAIARRHTPGLLDPDCPHPRSPRFGSAVDRVCWSSRNESWCPQQLSDVFRAVDDLEVFRAEVPQGRHTAAVDTGHRRQIQPEVQIRLKRQPTLSSQHRHPFRHDATLDSQRRQWRAFSSADSPGSPDRTPGAIRVEDWRVGVAGVLGCGAQWDVAAPSLSPLVLTLHRPRGKGAVLSLFSAARGDFVLFAVVRSLGLPLREV